jgi:hypothetical protein
MPPRKTLCEQTILLDPELPKEALSPEDALRDAVLQVLTTKLDLDGLARTLVKQVADSLSESITLSDLSEAIAAQHKEEIKVRLARAVLDRVRADA